MNALNSFYRGQVTNTQDPQGRGRIRLRVPNALGSLETGWATPLVSFQRAPSVGEVVWATFESGQPDKPLFLPGVFQTGNRVYSQATPPVNPAVGDIWYDTANQNKAYRWSGSAWESVLDRSLRDLEDLARSRVIAFTAERDPVATDVASEGELGINTEEGTTWRYTDGGWESVNAEYPWAAYADEARFLSVLGSATGRVDGKIRVSFQADAPLSQNAAEGDLWVDNANVLRAYLTESWVSISDSTSVNRLLAVRDELDLSDSGVTWWFLPSEPTTSFDGDLWFDISNEGRGNIWRREDGAWIWVRALIQVNADLLAVERWLRDQDVIDMATDPANWKAGAIASGIHIGSADYDAGVPREDRTGWAIFGDGSADFFNVEVRGYITGSIITGSDISGATITGGKVTQESEPYNDTISIIEMENGAISFARDVIDSGGGGRLGQTTIGQARVVVDEAEGEENKGDYVRLAYGDLDISGSSFPSGGMVDLRRDWVLISGPAGGLIVPGEEPSWMRVGKGAIEFGTPLRSTWNGSASAPIYSFESAPGTGMYRLSDGRIGFTVGGTVRVAVRSTGLDVAGGATVTGSIDAFDIRSSGSGGNPAGQDTVNYILHSNGYISVNRSGVSGFFGRSTSGNVVEFYRSGTNVGWVRLTVANAFYETASDYRLKEREGPIIDPLDALLRLKPYEGYFKSDPDTKTHFFFAHETQEAAPYANAASGEKDAVDEDGNIIPQGMDNGRLVPLLVASVQELARMVMEQE